MLDNGFLVQQPGFLRTSAAHNSKQRLNEYQLAGFVLPIGRILGYR